MYRSRMPKLALLAAITFLLGGCMSFVDPGGGTPYTPGPTTIIHIAEIHENRPAVEREAFPLFEGAQWIYRNATVDFNPEIHPASLLFREVQALVYCIDPHTGEAWECFVTSASEFPGPDLTMYLHRGRDGVLAFDQNLHDPQFDFPGYLLMPRTVVPGDLWAYNVPFAYPEGNRAATAEIYWDRATLCTELDDLDATTVFIRRAFGAEPVGISSQVSSVLGAYTSLFRDAYKIEAYDGIHVFPGGSWFTTEPTFVWTVPGIGIVKRVMNSGSVELLSFVKPEEVLLLDEETAPGVQQAEIGSPILIQLRGFDPRQSTDLNWYVSEMSFEAAEPSSKPILAEDDESRFYHDITTEGDRLLTGAYVFRFRAVEPGYATIRLKADRVHEDGDITERVYHLRLGEFNSTPIAGNDTATIEEDSPIVLTIQQGEPSIGSLEILPLLVNDSDRDPGDRLWFEAFETEPQKGTLEHVELGQAGTTGYRQWFVYQPNPDATGQDRFEYRIRDRAGATATGRITILITPVNDAPEGGSDAFSIQEDSDLTIEPPGLLENDFDVDGDLLSARPDRAPEHGTVEVHEDGSFLYRPDPDWSGTDAFTYLASDGDADSAPVAVSITVHPMNDAPVALPDVVEASPGDVHRVIAVLDNDLDPDEGDTLRILAIITDPIHGTAIHDGYRILYSVPATTTAAEDTLTYRISDPHGQTATAAVTVTIGQSP